MARIAYTIAQETLPRYSHPKSPPSAPAPIGRLRAAWLYLNTSYRDLEEWLLASDRVLEVLELKRVPDHTTLYRAYRRLRMEDWERMRRVLLAKLGVEGKEEGIAIDSTGFRLTQASAYYQSRTGRGATRLSGPSGTRPLLADGGVGTTVVFSPQSYL